MRLDPPPILVFLMRANPAFLNNESTSPKAYDFPVFVYKSIVIANRAASKGSVFELFKKNKTADKK